MHQRVAQSWTAAPDGEHTARVLIEADDPALAVSDFELFRQAGFEVSLCQGPGPEETCPVVEGEPCQLVEAADAVLHGLDPGLGVAAAIGRQYPDVPVVLMNHGRGAPASDQALPATTSVDGQIQALRHAVIWRRHRR